MGSLHRSAALLGFYADDLDPREITELIGAEPTVGVRKGGVWHTARGTEKIASTGSWRLNVERREPGDLNGQINELLDRLSDDLTAWRTLSKRYGGRIFCGLFLSSGNEGISLDADTVARLGERGLRVELDICGQDMLD